MTLRHFRNSYYKATAAVSEQTRKLAFAGIAVVWVYSVTPVGGHHVPDPLRLPTLLLVSSLASDFVQHVYRTVAWGLFTRYYEKRNMQLDDALDAPSWINWPSLTFFNLKILLLGLAYYGLISYLSRTL